MFSLLEIFFEPRPPGPVGSWDTAAPPSTVARRWVLVLRALFGAAILAGIGILVLEADHRASALTLAAIYLAVAYWARIEPDRSNTGLLGFIDHPLRWSDDLNRLLVVFLVILAPGRYALASVRDLVRHLRGQRVIVLRRHD